MRLYLYFIAFFLPMIASAAETHLNIRQPSLVVAQLNGPVKKVTEEYNYQMSDRKYKEVRAYDAAGNQTYRRKWNYKDELVYSSTNTFNEAGRMTRQKIEDIKDEKNYDYEIILNPKTRQMAYKCRITGDIEVITYNEAKYNISCTVKKKGKKNLPYSKYQRRPDNLSKVYTKYDDDGRVKYITATKRDSEGRVLQAITTYKREKRKTNNLYEYLAFDEFGNWTQRLLKITDLKDGEEKIYEKFSERTIEYYEGLDS